MELSSPANSDRILRAISRVLHCLGLAAGVGCGVDKSLQLGPVSGTVTLDGQPLSAGTISFEDVENGFASSARLQADGSFHVRCQHGEGLPVGKYLVAVNPPALDPDRRSGPSIKLIESSIPKKYRSSAPRILEAQVRSVSEPFHFDLQP